MNLRDGLRNTSLPLVAKPLLWWGGVPIWVGLEKAHCHAGSYRACPRAGGTILDKVGMFLDWQLTEPINIVTYFLWMLERKIMWSKWKTFFSCSFCFKNNLNLEIIRGLQTERWFSKEIFRTDLEETLSSSLHVWTLRATEFQGLYPTAGWRQCWV